VLRLEPKRRFRLDLSYEQRVGHYDPLQIRVTVTCGSPE
jgi:hypothetical protein